MSEAWNNAWLQVNLLEEQLVWAPMGPPSEAVAAACAPSTSQTSLLGPFNQATSASWSNVEGTPQRGPQITGQCANWAAQMRCSPSPASFKKHP